VLDTVRVLASGSGLRADLVRADSGAVADCAGTVHPVTLAHPVVRLAADSSGGTDPRDLLDRHEIDLVVTRDPVVLDYARRSAALRVRPLPWDRVYVLEPGGPSVADTTELRALARDAVPGDARGAEPPYWWREAGCAPAAGRLTSDDVSYPAGDPVARALAERLVALATMGAGRPAWLWPPVDRTRVPRAAAAPRSPNPTGPRVVVYPVQSPESGCAGGPWLATAQPLVTTRPALIVAEGVPPFEILADGSIRFLGAAR
jgi:hypothetical protein